MMTQRELEEIRQRAEKATSGPWKYADTSDDTYILDEGDSIVGSFERMDDAVFVAHARTDIPRLLDYIDRLEAQLNDLTPVGDLDAITSLRTEKQLYMEENTELRADLRRSSEVLAAAQDMIDDLSEQVRQERNKVTEHERRLSDDIEWFDAAEEEEHGIYRPKHTFDTLGIVFENCEEISVPSDQVRFIHMDGITESRFFQNILRKKGEPVSKHKTANNLLLVIDNKPEYDRITKYDDITQIHFEKDDKTVESFVVPWENGIEFGDNPFQKTKVLDDKIDVTIGKEAE